jgi:hypothetical protein
MRSRDALWPVFIFPALKWQSWTSCTLNTKMTELKFMKWQLKFLFYWLILTSQGLSNHCSWRHGFNDFVKSLLEHWERAWVVSIWCVANSVRLLPSGKCRTCIEPLSLELTCSSSFFNFPYDCVNSWLHMPIEWTVWYENLEMRFVQNHWPV